MNGAFLPQCYNSIFFSTPRSMARFGLLILNEGWWNGNAVLGNPEYFNPMVETSQGLNESYGHLWWLNGMNGHMVPQTQWIFDGAMFPNAPNDMVSAPGKDGQIINVVPSENLVWIRMGEGTEDAFVSLSLNTDIWDHINALNCVPLHTDEADRSLLDCTVFPNPAADRLQVNAPPDAGFSTFEVYTPGGRPVLRGKLGSDIPISALESGVYFLRLYGSSPPRTVKFVKE